MGGAGAEPAKREQAAKAKPKPKPAQRTRRSEPRRRQQTRRPLPRAKRELLVSVGAAAEMQGGQRMDEYVRSLPRYPRRPEEVFREWALREYRVLYSELTAREPQSTPRG